MLAATPNLLPVTKVRVLEMAHQTSKELIKITRELHHAEQLQKVGQIENTVAVEAETVAHIENTVAVEAAKRLDG